MSYWIGRLGGRPLLERLVERDRRQRLARLVQRRVAAIVVGGRIVPVVRPEASLLAGAVRLPYMRFLAWDLVGCLAWAMVWSAVGRLVGQTVNLVAVLDTASSYVLGAVVGVLVLIVLGSVARTFVHVRRRRP